MPWVTPSLTDWRKQSRDYVVANLPVRGVLLPNSPMRVMADNSAGLAYQEMLYLAWLADQLLPDTAEKEWLDRHAAIWLPNSGRKPAVFASGSATVTGLSGVTLPSGSLFTAQAADGTTLQYQTTAAVDVGSTPVAVPMISLTAGSDGNLDAGAVLSLVAGPPGGGVDSSATVVSMAGGTDEETDDELRVRVLARIRKPPMGGDASDYEAWALQVSGVTRAWCSPLEMGPGTVTLRFMMDDLRQTNSPTTNGFPLAGDVTAVAAYLATVRPVTDDLFVTAPTPQPISYTVHLSPDTTALRTATEASVAAMLKAKGAPAYAVNGVGQPAQTIYAAWVSDAILNTPGISYIDLTMSDQAMANAGCIAVPGTATYV